MVFNLKARHPTITEFASIHSESLMRKACNTSTQMAFLADKESPTLAIMEKAYGTQQTQAWMLRTLRPVFDLTLADTDAKTQLTTIVEVCFERFNNRRAKTWLIFCAKCLSREYKISYGTIKTDAVLDAANTFLQQLPKMERQMTEEAERNREEKMHVPDYDTYLHITLKGRLKAAWDTARKVYEQGREAAIKRYLICDRDIRREDPTAEGVNADLQIVTKLRLLTFENGKAIFQEDRYYSKLKELKD